MVMSFFRRSDTGIEAIANRTVSMIGDARHSFDLASAAVLSGADPEAVGIDVRQTDERINRAEQEIRGELVVHAAVHGTENIAVVMSYTLLIKKIERIGDQAKNILDLADEGVSFAGEPDIEVLLDHRRTISTMMGETADLINDPDQGRVAEFRDRADDLRRELETQIRGYMHSEEAGSYAVPRAILYRYWKRIVANLAGVVTTATEPFQHQIQPGQEDPNREDEDVTDD